MTEESQVKMFGKTIREMRESAYFIDLEDPVELVSYATMVLSDAQEALRRGDSDVSRQWINKAKYFNAEAVMKLRKR